MVLKMEPLAEAQPRCVAPKVLQRQFRRAVLAQKAHVEMAVVGGAFGLPMPRGSGPCPRQVVKTVPVNARRLPDKKLGGAIHAPRLHLLRPKGRNTHLADPDGQI